MRVRFSVHCNLCFYSQSLPTIAIPSVRSAYYIVMHEISLLWIPKQRPLCKPNPETGSRDYIHVFLNTGSQD